MSATTARTLSPLFVFYCKDLEETRRFYDCCGLALVAFPHRRSYAMELADCYLELCCQTDPPKPIDTQHGYVLRGIDPQSAIALLRLAGFGAGIGPDNWVTDPDGRRVQLIPRK